ncbi:hypothetical protein P9250_06470 [Caballeronia sp. LP006]|jgi:hypothetical protein|uniref:hypothetical protein n=2 Tax=unclassified Caballeronia TaxID=2646786 RepID=UPI001FCFAAA4|nr:MULTISPECIES: hypothetical protein [unclassified Caballeronia]MDR5827511.1 hypothetical protein [Caballeronia sp. LP006]
MFSPSYTPLRSLYSAHRACGEGLAAAHFQAFLLCEFLMKMSLKKAVALLAVAAIFAPSVSFAEAQYPNNKPRPAYKKHSHKHHAKKAAAASQ